MKQTELRVNINCQKCKTQVFKAVTKLQGVDSVVIDAEKGIVTVVGDVDPVCVTKRIRKSGRNAEMISVGSPKKPEDKEPDPPLPPCCPECQVIVSYGYEPSDFGRTCTIL